MTFKEFCKKYSDLQAARKSATTTGDKVYKVRVIDKTVGDNAPKLFMDMTGHVITIGKSKIDAQKRVRRFGRICNILIETGFAVEVK
jgi:hypothetical protein